LLQVWDKLQLFKKHHRMPTPPYLKARLDCPAYTTFSLFFRVSLKASQKIKNK
jgi:hypothetical protein